MSAQISLLADIKSQDGTSTKLDYEFNNHFRGDSPLSNVFRRNSTVLQTLLIPNSFDYIEFSEHKWEHSPDIFCLDYYGNPDLYLVILLVNHLKSRFEFTSANLQDSLIVAPKSNSIYSVMSSIWV